MTHPLVVISGWAAKRGEAIDPQIYINGERHAYLQTFERPDVLPSYPGWAVKGWRVHCDVVASMSKEHPVILVDLVEDGIIIERKLYRSRIRHSSIHKPALNLFLHIPKCGGTSLRLALSEYSEFITILGVYDDQPPVEQFSSLSVAALDSLDVIFGHRVFELDVDFGRPVRRLSVVRNPLALIRSLYFYQRYYQMDPSLQNVRSIVEWIENNKNYHNFITWHFAHRVGGLVGDDLLSIAKQNIEQNYDFIGVSEFEEDTFCRFSEYFGVNLTRRRDNVTPDSVEASTFDAAAFRKAARKYFELDFELYEFILDRFWGSSGISQRSVVAPEGVRHEPVSAEVAAPRNGGEAEGTTRPLASPY